MTNNEIKDIPVTYITMGGTEVFVGTAGTDYGVLKFEGRRAGTVKVMGLDDSWVEGTITDGSFASELTELGGAAREATESFNIFARKFNREASFTLHNPSVGFTALMQGISKRQVREWMGYIPRKPLIHKGKKPTW